MADINDYLEGLNYSLNAEEKQLMDIFAECWEHCHNIKCENCEYRSADEYCKMLICISYQYARRLIAADVAPVHHGHWEQVDDTKCKCSECEIITMIAQYPIGADANYCPNCGAKMDGDAK